MNEPITNAAPPPPPQAGLPRRYHNPWSTRHKIARVLWGMVSATLFRCSFHNWYPLRASLLRLFGAKLGQNVRIRRTVHVEIPWNLCLGDNVLVGDFAILYALGTIRIGDRSLVSQYAHLCAGTHDYRSRDYPLLRPPIIVGEDCWIAADAFVGPGVTVGDRSIVGARASVFSDVPTDVIVGGNPARVIKARELQE